MRRFRAWPLAAVFVASLVACTGSGTSGSGHHPLAAMASSTTTSRSAVTTTSSPSQFHTVETHVTIKRQSNPLRPVLSVLVFYPVGKGPFPLIVFSHGFNSVAALYTSFLEHLSRAGFVVAGPDFPSNDYRTHPADISRVIDNLTGDTNQLPRGLVDPKNIAVAGHSLGGADVYGVVYNSCCRDSRITAAFTIEAPGPGTFPGGKYLWRGPPLLMVQGDADPIIAPDAGAQVLRHFTTPAYLLSVRGGDHGGGMTPQDTGYSSVQATLREFLAAYLKHDRIAQGSLRSMIAQPQATLQQSR